MGEKLIVGPIEKGQRTDRTAFNIDNDSFPVLINAYQWRGRVKRKRGTSLLGRLQRFFDSTISSYNTGSATIVLDGTGSGNILTGFGLPASANIVPGDITITDTTTSIVYTDLSKDGTLSPSGTINYSTGEITIPGAAGDTIEASFLYYPILPVLGLRTLTVASQPYPGQLAFDTTYAYNIINTFPFSIYDVSFYKNPAVDSVNLPGYVPKAFPTPTTWNGEDYQQFWSINYEGAFWVTNGINIPFDITNIGMQFGTITGATIGAGGPPAIVTFLIAGSPLIIGDFVFVNEIVGMTGINFQSGYVTAINPGVSVTVEFPFSTVAGTWMSGGILQYLTNRSSTIKDCLRWYDGDPTNGSAIAPGFARGFGWVNFAPPLSQQIYSIADRPAEQYYLVGARIILPFKDRLLFIGPVIQTSSAGSQVYLQDTVIYSQNGTPYYTTSYTNTPTATVDNPTNPDILFHPILVPSGFTATSPAWFEDSTGFGGFVKAGVDQPIVTASANGDVLILGFGGTLQTKLVSTGNDIVPFDFFLINSELPSNSTFSVINLDKGVLTRGNRGLVITSQVEATRFDLDIPDTIFEFNLLNNGAERVTAIRDFVNEWIYFSYTNNNRKSIFNNQTLIYNYRDNSWGTFYESYTAYGQFNKQSGFTWATVGFTYPTWSVWNDPWGAGASTLLQPLVIAGNQQGFVMIRDQGTSEQPSIYIQAFSGGMITSPNHGLNNGDYIIINGVLGTIGTLVNGNIFKVNNATLTTFNIDPPIGMGTYLGGGLITRMYIPFIQTRQFPIAWNMARKTRIGPQQYLLTTTNFGQVQLFIYLSQSSSSPFNQGPIVPSLDPDPDNNSLIYSTVLFTCPESTNLGLTPANISLQMISFPSTTGRSSTTQEQIWHRVNTSLIGDTIQLGITLSDTQMRDINFASQFAEIELHSFIMDVNPSQLLS
jgi:hypothetical protein